MSHLPDFDHGNESEHMEVSNPQLQKSEVEASSGHAEVAKLPSSENMSWNTGSGSFYLVGQAAQVFKNTFQKFMSPSGVSIKIEQDNKTDVVSNMNTGYFETHNQENGNEFNCSLNSTLCSMYESVLENSSIQTPTDVQESESKFTTTPMPISMLSTSNCEQVKRRKKVQPLSFRLPRQKSRFKTKVIAQVYSSDDDSDNAIPVSPKRNQYEQIVKRRQDTKKEIEVLHDLVNPKPSTSQALQREMARIKKLYSKSTSGGSSISKYPKRLNSKKRSLAPTENTFGLASKSKTISLPHTRSNQKSGPRCNKIEYVVPKKKQLRKLKFTSLESIGGKRYKNTMQQIRSINDKEKRPISNISNGEEVQSIEDNDEISDKKKQPLNDFTNGEDIQPIEVESKDQAVQGMSKGEEESLMEDIPNGNEKTPHWDTGNCKKLEEQSNEPIINAKDEETTGLTPDDKNKRQNGLESEHPNMVLSNTKTDQSFEGIKNAKNEQPILVIPIGRNDCSPNIPVQTELRRSTRANSSATTQRLTLNCWIPTVRKISRPIYGSKSLAEQPIENIRSQNVDANSTRDFVLSPPDLQTHLSIKLFRLDPNKTGDLTKKTKTEPTATSNLKPSSKPLIVESGSLTMYDIKLSTQPTVRINRFPLNNILEAFKERFSSRAAKVHTSTEDETKPPEIFTNTNHFLRRSTRPRRRRAVMDY